MDYLKLCPYCGGEGMLVDDATFGYGMASTTYNITCRDCGARTAEYFTQDEAEEAWNRRELKGA